MNPPYTRIRKRRASQRQLPDPHQTLSVLRRRSSRIQSRQHSVSIPHILGSCYELHLEQRPTYPQTSQPAGATSHTRVLTPNLVEPAPVACPPQTHNHKTRKRTPDRSIEISSERPPKRARLTKENLKAFEKMGGRAGKPGKEPKSKLSQSRKSPNSEAKSKSSATTESSSKTVSTTDSNFPHLAYANGILQEPNAKPPINIKLLQDRVDRHRGTASPTESEYEVAAHKLLVAENEGTIAEETSKLLKDYRVTEYRRATNLPFKDFPKNVGFNNGLSAAQPDMIEGLEMPEFDPFPVSEELGGAAIPYLSPNAITLPHLAGEWKGPGKDMNLARLQAAYDGASMVYGRNTARSFLANPDPIGHASIVTFTSDGTSVRTFANYSLETQGQIKYHQYPITSTFITSGYENFKRGRRQLRNLQDYAKETSEKLRDELNDEWAANQRLNKDDEDSYELVRSPVSPSIPAETTDFADCNSYDYNGEEDPTSQLLTEYWTSFSAGNQDESSLQIPAADSVYAPPYASFPANNQDDPFMQISTADNGYTSPNALTFSIITPPQSSKNVLLPLESSEESSEDIDDSNVRGHRRTRRTRTRVVDTVEEPSKVDHKSNARKTRRKH